MSWWVSLLDDNNQMVEVPKFSEGGTLALGGTTKATLNVTYNYSAHFAQAIETIMPNYQGFRELLNGATASAVAPILAKAALTLGTIPSSNYWEKDPGNAGRALNILALWAIIHPNATFEVD